MVAKLKVMCAIMATLFAIGFEAEAGHVDLFGVCGTLNDLLFWDQKESTLGTEELMSLAESYIHWTDMFMRERLMKAWATIVHQSDCEESSLETVHTIAECRPNNVFGILRNATVEYASKCLDAKYIRGRIEANWIEQKNRCFSVSTSCFRGKDTRDVSELLDHQFFVNYWSENPQNRLSEMVNINETELVGKAVLRKLKENSNMELEDVYDVHKYLKERLYKPCSAYLRASKKIMESVISSSVYLGGYEKLLSLLESDDYTSTQEDIIRYSLCKKIKLRDDPKISISTEIRSYMRALSRS